jgi:hypothetical protein
VPANTSVAAGRSSSAATIVSNIKVGEVRSERVLVLETAQIKNLRSILRPPDSGNRQLSKRSRKARKRPPGGALLCGRIANAALGKVSSGSAPDPIWLAQSMTSTANSPQRSARDGAPSL